MIEQGLDTRTAARRNGRHFPENGVRPHFSHFSKFSLPAPITVFAFPQHWCYDKPTAERHRERLIAPYWRHLGVTSRKAHDQRIAVGFPNVSLLPFLGTNRGRGDASYYS
jgi:hypothetical protein